MFYTSSVIGRNRACHAVDASLFATAATSQDTQQSNSLGRSENELCGGQMWHKIREEFVLLAIAHSRNILKHDVIYFKAGKSAAFLEFYFLNN